VVRPRRTAPAKVVLARGERVALREPIHDDEREFLALREASRDFLAPWEPELPGVGFASPALFLRYMRFGPRFKRRRLLVCAPDDGRILGSITLSEIERAKRRAVLGYWIGAEHARRGYMREALGLTAELAFGAMELKQLEAFVLPENTPSKRLLEVCGFAHVGVAPAYRVIRGEARNHERWTLTAPSRAGSGSPD
jgi:[ribosomal protein S5]-alanine N-acetyltransferase